MSEKRKKLGLTMSGKSAYLVPLIWCRKKKKRHLSDSNTRGQRPTALPLSKQIISRRSR